MKNIVILISGRGSNMQAIVQACQTQNWPAKIAAVISNEPDAAGLDWAAQRAIDVKAVSHKAYESRADFDAALAQTIDAYHPALVVLAGFMRILTPEFVAHYENRMINIHPSLLPEFPGLHTHRRAIEAGHEFSGATVHWVTAQLDHGPILGQVKVPILPGDTEDTLALRVLEQEHHLYPDIIRQLIEK